MTIASETETATSSAKRQFCTFWVSDRLYGVPILDVMEINSELDFTPIFHSPAEVEGYVNIRGHIHLIIELRLLLGFERCEKSATSRIVLFKPTVGDSFGVSVDRIGDVVEVDADEIEERDLQESAQSDDGECHGSGGDLTAGVCKLDGELLVILDTSRFLSAVKMLREPN